MQKWKNSLMKNKIPYKKGKKSGPPPKSGPTPQGLNLSYNTVKDVKLTEKINGRRR